MRITKLLRPLLTLIGTFSLVLAFQMTLGDEASASATTTLSLLSGSGTQYLSANGTWQPVAQCAQLGPWHAPFAGSIYVADVPIACTWSSPYLDRTITFRQTFKLPARHSNASLKVSWYADNSAQVLLNGTRIGGNNDAAGYAAGTQFFAAAATAETKSGLRSGTNVLTFVLHNWGAPKYAFANPYGLDFAGSVTFTPPPAHGSEGHEDQD